MRPLAYALAKNLPSQSILPNHKFNNAYFIAHLYSLSNEKKIAKVPCLKGAKKYAI